MQAAEEADSVNMEERPLLPAWVMIPCHALAWSIGLLLALIVMSMSEQAARGLLLPEVLIAFMGLLVMVFLATLIHEGGHAFGARLAGMKIFLIHAGPLELKRWGSAYRWRLRRPKGAFSGLTLAFPDPRRPLYPAYVRFVLGGPLANFVVALVAAPAFLLDNRLSGFFAAFALLNFGIGVINLLPYGGKGYLSDGLQLVAWRYRWRNDESASAYLKLMGFSVFGTTAEKLPSALVAQLDKQGPAMQLVAAWLRLKASQNIHQWHAARQIEAEIDQITAELSQAFLLAINELLVLLRLEIAFSRAMEERSAGPVAELRLGKGVDWLAPHLRPRFAALSASLQGDRRGAEQHLEQTLRLADASPDISLRESEMQLARAIRGL